MSSGQSNKRSILVTGLSADEKKRIVDIHNELRQKIASGKETRGKPGPQPAAKSMPNVEWDDELAQLAQKWADQCKFSHDPNRKVSRFIIGQNIALAGTSADIKTLTVEDMVKTWYNEVDFHPRSNASSFNAGVSSKCGHYTQLVWAQSTLIGAGAIRYKEGPFNRFHLVCNYGPSGNLVGAPVYEVVQ